jgi:hypothetical protein
VTIGVAIVALLLGFTNATLAESRESTTAGAKQSSRTVVVVIDLSGESAEWVWRSKDSITGMTVAPVDATLPEARGWYLVDVIRILPPVGSAKERLRVVVRLDALACAGLLRLLGSEHRVRAALLRRRLE